MKSIIARLSKILIAFTLIFSITTASTKQAHAGIFGSVIKIVTAPIVAPITAVINLVSPPKADPNTSINGGVTKITSNLTETKLYINHSDTVKMVKAVNSPVGFAVQAVVGLAIPAGIGLVLDAWIYLNINRIEKVDIGNGIVIKWNNTLGMQNPALALATFTVYSQ